MSTSRVRARRGAALLGAVSLAIGLGALPAASAVRASVSAATGATGDPAKPGAPAQPDAPVPPPAACTLVDPDSPRDEFSDCVTADVDLLSTPALGATATAEVVVTSSRAIAGAVVALSLGEHFSLVAAPGFSAPASAVSGVGATSRVSRTVDLAAGKPTRLTIEVRAESDGLGVIQAEVTGRDVFESASDETAVPLGTPAAPVNGAYPTVEAPAGARRAPTDAADRLPKATASVDGPQSLAPSAPGASCAAGRWVFNNELGQQVGSMNYQVQVWDRDTSGGDDLLAVAVTGGGGNYNVCFESTDSDQGGGQEVYVKFVSSNNAWRVRNTPAANQSYDFSTGVQNLPDPGTASFGTLQPSDGALHRALHAFDSLNLLYLWQSGVNSSCIDDPGQCRQMILNWTPSSTDGTYYSLSDNDIHLDSDDPDSDHITIHEGSHALMDSIYEDDFPPAPSCSPHSIFGTSSTGCAWTEGWAEWLPARVLNDPFFRFENGSGPNLETPGWTDGQAQGDAVEGRIAGALIDLSDFSNEAPWDRYGEGGGGAASEEIYTTNLIQVSDTLSEYFNLDRAGEGDTGFLARTAIFANTINYTQRDPLLAGAQLTRPSLSVQPTPHNYSFTTVNSFWSGVGIRGANDNDITVYDDVAQSTSLASSAFGGSAIDYVLIDSNGRALGDYYPRARLFSGSGAYDIEWSAGSTTYAEGATTVGFGTGDVISVRDAFASSGVTNYVRVVPTSGLDVELAAHVSTEANTASFVQGRSSAVASSSSQPAGGAEAISYTITPGDWTGVVVLNKGGSGIATVYRDQSAPTSASVSIDGGTATTASRSVSLTLAASDPQTGMLDMRISTDDTFDTESFQPYATSATATLPSGVGTKTVTVQFRNRAGAITTASDTIVLEAAVCGGSRPTITGSGAITGTTGNDVILHSET